MLIAEFVVVVEVDSRRSVNSDWKLALLAMEMCERLTALLAVVLLVG